MADFWADSLTAISLGFRAGPDIVREDLAIVERLTCVARICRPHNICPGILFR